MKRIPCPECGHINPPRFSRCRSCDEPMTVSEMLRDLAEGRK